MQGAGYFDEHTTPIRQRLAIGLYKLGLAVKHEERRQSIHTGLSPTQAEILTFLVAEGARTPSEAASVLGVSLPTVSDSVSALVAKGLVMKKPDPTHHRAIFLTLTRAGRAAAQRVIRWPEFLLSSLGTLSDTQQESLLSSLVSLLREMQEDGQIPVQRMCVTCTFFRPNVHAGERPHHCAFVDAAMGPAHLRLVCDEHEMASVEVRSTQWQRFCSPVV